MNEEAPTPDAGGIVTTPGLLNMGNTCYVNAVLQALRMTPVMADAVLQRLQGGGGEEEGGRGGALAHAWHALQVAMWAAPAETQALSPRALLHALHGGGLLSELGAQGDAAEFAERFLDALHEEAATGGGHRPLTEEPVAPAWRAFCATARGSHVAAGLYGLLQTQSTCGTCGVAGKPRFEPFACLRVPVAAGGTPEACLRGAFGDEELPDFACEACGTRGAATLRTRAAVLPPCLLLAVKRFGNDGRKVATPIPWDAQCVDLTPFTAAAAAAALCAVTGAPHPAAGRYLVYATVQHVGVAEAGHYTAQVRGGDSAASAGWVEFDDGVASGLPEGAPTAAGGAYLLLLCRPSVWDAFAHGGLRPLREAALAAPGVVAAASPSSSPMSLAPASPSSLSLSLSPSASPPLLLRITPGPAEDAVVPDIALEA